MRECCRPVQLQKVSHARRGRMSLMEEGFAATGTTERRANMVQCSERVRA